MSEPGVKHPDFSVCPLLSRWTPRPPFRVAPLFCVSGFLGLTPQSAFSQATHWHFYLLKRGIGNFARTAIMSRYYQPIPAVQTDGEEGMFVRSRCLPLTCSPAEFHCLGYPRCSFTFTGLHSTSLQSNPWWSSGRDTPRFSLYKQRQFPLSASAKYSHWSSIWRTSFWIRRQNLLIGHILSFAARRPSISSIISKLSISLMVSWPNLLLHNPSGIAEYNTFFLLPFSCHTYISVQHKNILQWSVSKQ